MPLHIWLVIFMIFLLPLWIAEEAWALYKAHMAKDKSKRWENLPYHLLIFFIVLLLVVISMKGGLY
ncbi:MAG: hypothetical protein WD991_01650 [Candidatus Paceibacterota bacterium]